MALLGVVCHAVYRGEQGPIIRSRMAVGRLDEFLTCQKFWSADLGSRTVETEQCADFPMSVNFFSLRLRWTENTEAGLVEL